MSFLQKFEKYQARKMSYAARVAVLANRKTRYQQMLMPFYEAPGKERMDQPAFWDDLIDRSVKALKREDRIMWFLKKARATRPAFKGKNTDNLKSSEVEELLQNLGHYISNAEVSNFEELLKYEWKNQTVEKLLSDLDDLDKKMKVKSRLVTQGEDKTLIHFADGWEWHLLDRYCCRKEGAAMSHCGNCAHGREGQKILSLREPMEVMGEKFWIPHATFILNEDGSIGEMKGYNNKKPESKLHPYIVKLLEHEKIKKIKGGGHASHENFKLKDLDETVKTELLEKRPELTPTKETDVENIIERINDFVASEIEYRKSPEEGEQYSSYFTDEIGSLSKLEILRRVEEDLKPKVEALYFLDKDNFHDKIIECCNLDFRDYYYTNTNELASVPLGEIETELPDDLAEELEDLSEEELEEVKRKIDATLKGGYLYINLDYSSHILVLDESLLDDVLEDIKKAEIERISQSKLKKYVSTEIKEHDRDDGYDLVGILDDENEEVIYSIPFDDKFFMEDIQEAIEENIKDIM